MRRLTPLTHGLRGRQPARWQSSHETGPASDMLARLIFGPSIDRHKPTIPERHEFENAAPPRRDDSKSARRRFLRRGPHCASLVRSIVIASRHPADEPTFIAQRNFFGVARLTESPNDPTSSPTKRKRLPERSQFRRKLFPRKTPARFEIFPRTKPNRPDPVSPNEANSGASRFPKTPTCLEVFPRTKPIRPDELRRHRSTPKVPGGEPDGRFAGVKLEFQSAVHFDKTGGLRGEGIR